MTTTKNITINLSRPSPDSEWHADLRRLGFELTRYGSRTGRITGSELLSAWRMTGHPNVICEIRDCRASNGMILAEFETSWHRYAYVDVNMLHDVTTVLIDWTGNESEDTVRNVIDLRPIDASPTCKRLRALGFTRKDDTYWTLTDDHGRVSVTFDQSYTTATITDFETQAETQLDFNQLAHVDHITHGWN